LCRTSMTTARPSLLLISNCIGKAKLKAGNTFRYRLSPSHLDGWMARPGGLLTASKEKAIVSKAVVARFSYTTSAAAIKATSWQYKPNIMLLLSSTVFHSKIDGTYVYAKIDMVHMFPAANLAVTTVFDFSLHFSVLAAGSDNHEVVCSYPSCSTPLMRHRAGPMPGSAGFLRRRQTASRVVATTAAKEDPGTAWEPAVTDSRNTHVMTVFTTRLLLGSQTYSTRR